MKHVRFIYRSIVILFLLGLNPDHAFATNCEALGSMTISHIEITSATEVAAGEFKPLTKSEPGEPAGLSESVPAFCRVIGVAQPTNDSSANEWLERHNCSYKE
jgi:hypothetical protein